jgi:hypothetical protein
VCVCACLGGKGRVYIYICNVRLFSHEKSLDFFVFLQPLQNKARLRPGSFAI